MISAPFRFEGRTAIITGAASGIGAALAEALCKRGCHLALADIDEPSLHATAVRLTRPGCKITATRADVSRPSDIASFAGVVEREHGQAHLLVNNAGVALVGDFEQLAEADFDWLIAVNFLGVVRMTRAFLPLLRRADTAHIANLSSLFGIIAPPGQTAYAASKFAVRGFSDALRHELRGSNIGVTTVHPGGVRTSIARRAHERQGTLPEDLERSVRRAERLLSMAPGKAAAIILRAVERRKPRALVGADAHLAALVERLAPASYWTLLGGRRKRPSS